VGHLGDACSAVHLRGNRGAYCSMTIISLLNLPLELPPDSPARIHGSETFLTGLAEWVGRCQAFEGGIASSPGNEAHGGYAFCALACLSILGPPPETIPRSVIVLPS
jgi:protein farnesyltransferase subunit beta